jgi:hypothetical protein
MSNTNERNTCQQSKFQSDFFLTETEEEKPKTSALKVAAVAAPVAAFVGTQLYCWLNLDAGETLGDIVVKLFECAEEGSDDSNNDSLDRLLVIRHIQLVQMAAGAQACKLITQSEPVRAQPVLHTNV